MAPGLEPVVQAATSLLAQLQLVLADIHKNPASAPSSGSGSSGSPSTPLDALAAARDSASLIRAHATKVSLLIINEPFTASAVSTVVRELVAGPIPGLATAVQACEPSRYTAVFRRELAWRAQRVLSELSQLLQTIPKDGKVLAGEKKDGGRGGKGSMASTGVLWSACDDVVGLATAGVGGFFVKKVEDWRDTLRDVLDELKEWGDEEPDDDDDDDQEDDDVDDLADNMGNSHLSTQAMLDDLMNSHRTIPASDPDRIRPRLESSLKRIRLVILLYQAITKRRIKKLPTLPPADPASTVPQRLDESAAVLEKLPDRFGDLAGAFYELQPDDIDRAMDQCFFDAFAASEILSQGWDGGRDEFSEWTDKFQTEIKKE